MAGRIPRDFISDLTTQVDIVDLIHTRVPLKKTGREYVARCPFHNEKTPSFSVNREKQVYHCFGCGASGDVIHFLIAFEHLSFVESVETLATLQGLTIPRGVIDPALQVQQQSLKHIYTLQEKVAAFFSFQLRHHTLAQTVVTYLKSRGISGKVAARYSLGFSPPGWHTLATEFAPDLLLQAGLIKKKEKDARPYDHFRNRLMFPIKDRRGRVLGFGGRVLDDSEPKYLNSPETDTFQKGKQVYGLYELLQVVSKPERILVVEGYMDVIALAQHQIPYAVATLGTTTSEAQIHLLFRQTAELVFCFDGDQAGKKAAWKALNATLPCLLEGRKIRFMVLPDQQDPDSLVRSEGSAQFQTRITEAILLSDYFFNHLLLDLDLKQIEGRSHLLSMARPLIKQLPAGVFQQMMQTKLNDLAQIPADSSVKLVPERIRGYSSPVVIKKPVRNRMNLPSNMRTAITLLLQNPELLQTIDSKLITLLPTIPGGTLFMEILDGLQQVEDASSESIIQWFQGKLNAPRVIQLAQKKLVTPSEGIDAEFQGACLGLLEQELEKRLGDLVDKASQGTGLTDHEQAEMKQLLKKVKR